MGRRRNPESPFVSAKIDKSVMSLLDLKIHRGETLSQGLKRILEGGDYERF
jgi:hypothetical protein